MERFAAESMVGGIIVAWKCSRCSEIFPEPSAGSTPEGTILTEEFSRRVAKVHSSKPQVNEMMHPCGPPCSITESVSPRRRQECGYTGCHLDLKKNALVKGLRSPSPEREIDHEEASGVVVRALLGINADVEIELSACST